MYLSANPEAVTRFYAIATRRIDECDEFTKKAINDIASSHVMTLEGKPDADFTYSSCEFRDGKLVLVFNPKNVSNNIGRAAEEEEILPALNLADQSSPISFMARRNIIDTYDRQIDAKKAAIERILGKPVTLTPNFEENFIKLKPVMDAMDNRWDHSFGNFTFQYFHGVERQLEWQKFEGDDLLQGGFFEVVSDAEIVFQVVDKLEDLNRSYNEIVSRDGKLYLQTVPSQWGVNSSDTADLLIGKL